MREGKKKNRRKREKKKKKRGNFLKGSPIGKISILLTEYTVILEFILTKFTVI